jgi:hypothetical protein
MNIIIMDFLYSYFFDTPAIRDLKSFVRNNKFNYNRSSMCSGSIGINHPILSNLTVAFTYNKDNTVTYVVAYIENNCPYESEIRTTNNFEELKNILKKFIKDDSITTLSKDDILADISLVMKKY